MPPLLCSAKCGQRAVLKRPKTGDALCKDCFYWAFETEIHFTITKSKLFKKGDYVAIGASGGKDSTVLAYVMKTLNERFNYGLKLVLLSIDEGISGYRDDSLETVKRNRDQYEIPLKILSYKDLYGWTMDKIVSTVGRKNNCTFCGVFRRQALDRGAMQLGNFAIFSTEKDMILHDFSTFCIIFTFNRSKVIRTKLIKIWSKFSQKLVKRIGQTQSKIVRSKINRK